MLTMSGLPRHGAAARNDHAHGQVEALSCPHERHRS